MRTPTKHLTAKCAAREGEKPVTLPVGTAIQGVIRTPYCYRFRAYHAGRYVILDSDSMPLAI